MLQQLSNQIRHGVLTTLGKLARNDATGGVAMLICTVLALILQNGSYSTAYRHWLDMMAGINFGNFTLEKPLLLWINDGLITIFFFSIGLELKIEFIKGHLSDIRNVLLPSLAAIGGIVAPSLVFILFNYDNDFAMNGWAIPTSTDTAFSVGLILLLGKRVPNSLKIFLLSTAIFDDIGAILVIALFYTSALSVPALIGASFSILGLAILNYLKVGRSLLYLIFGILLWFSILKSGVHATLAGIITAFFIPMKDGQGKAMVEDMFEDLKVWVAMVVLPIFTIANAGVDLSNISLKDFFSPVSLGIFLGLVVGKQLGIFGVIMMCLKLRWVKMPEDANIKQIYGVCILTGIGFSMSMFIDTLAYQGSNVFNYADSLAILMASLVSGTAGYLYLRFYACKTKEIEYRPWLPAPEGYRGNATTANLYALEPKVGPSSVAPTAALVAAANARVAAANAALQAANKAAAAAAEVAEAMQQVVTNKDDDESVAKVQAAAAAAAAAAADAAVTSTQLDTSEEHEDNMDVVQSAAGAAQQAANVAIEAAEAAKVEAQAAKAEKAEAEKAEAEKADAEKAEKSDSEPAEGADDEGKADEEADNSSEATDKSDSAEAKTVEDDGISNSIIKTVAKVAKVAKDTASMAADVAASILNKDDEAEGNDDDKKAQADKSEKANKVAESAKSSAKSADAAETADASNVANAADNATTSGESADSAQNLEPDGVKAQAKAQDQALSAETAATSEEAKVSEQATSESSHLSESDDASKADEAPRVRTAEEIEYIKDVFASTNIPASVHNATTADNAENGASEKSAENADVAQLDAVQTETVDTAVAQNKAKAQAKTALETEKVNQAAATEDIAQAQTKLPTVNLRKEDVAKTQAESKVAEADTVVKSQSSAVNAEALAEPKTVDAEEHSESSAAKIEIKSEVKGEAQAKVVAQGEQTAKTESTQAQVVADGAQLTNAVNGENTDESVKSAEKPEKPEKAESAEVETKPKSEIKSESTAGANEADKSETEDEDEDEGEFITLDVRFSIPSAFPDDEDGDLAEDVVMPKDAAKSEKATVAQSAQQLEVPVLECPEKLTAPALADTQSKEPVVQVVAQAQVNTLTEPVKHIETVENVRSQEIVLEQDIALEESVAQQMADKTAHAPKVVASAEDNVELSDQANAGAKLNVAQGESKSAQTETKADARSEIKVEAQAELDPQVEAKPAAILEQTKVVVEPQTKVETNIAAEAQVEENTAESKDDADKPSKPSVNRLTPEEEAAEKNKGGLFKRLFGKK